MAVELTETPLESEIILQARKLLLENKSLNNKQKSEVEALLTNRQTATIKIAEFLMEGKNFIFNSKDYNSWLQQLLLFTKQVYGEAPTMNIELKADITQAIRQAYKERSEKENFVEVVKEK